MLLVGFPDDLALSVLKDWSSLRDLTLLDTACCCIFRSWLLDIYSHQHFIPSDHTGYIDIYYYLWILRRDIKPVTVEFDGDESVLTSLIIKKFENVVLKTSAVTTLILREFDSDDAPADDIRDYINSCPNLTSLTLSRVDSVTDYVIEGIVQQILKQLTSLTIKIEHFSDFSQSSIKILALNCNKLVSIQLNLPNYIGNQNSFSLLFSSNPQLESISLSAPKVVIDNNLINDLATSNHNLTELNIENCRRISLSAINHLQSKCSKLTEIHISHKSRGGTFQYEINYNEEYKRIIRTLSVNAIGNELNADGSLYLKDYIMSHTDFSEVFFYGISVLNNDIISTITENNPQLRNFGVCECGQNFTAQSIVNLLSKCKSMREIRLNSGLTQFTHSDYINILCNTQHKLKIIMIMYCDVLDTLDITNIVNKNSRYLKELHLTGCGKVVKSEVKKYLKKKKLTLKFFYA